MPSFSEPSRWFGPGLFLGTVAFCVVRFGSRPKGAASASSASDHGCCDCMAKAATEDFTVLHEQACGRGEDTYIDPATGFTVFTQVFHKKRGYCCGSGCRHCPYNHENVKTQQPPPKSAAVATPPATPSRDFPRSPSRTTTVGSVLASRSSTIPDSPSSTSSASGHQRKQKPVKSNSIYTRTGDDGTTSLFNGSRLPKHDAIFDAFGDIDELNSYLGLIGAEIVGKDPYRRFARQLHHIQNKLMDLGAEIANPGAALRIGNKYAFGEENAELLEEWIDELMDTLPNICKFVLPGGSPITSHIHVARTICRRAERSILRVGNPLSNPDIIRPAVSEYVNRLSDFLFAAARFAAYVEGAEEEVVCRNEQWREEEEF